MVDGEFVEGIIKIDKDTIYNGVIKFYDTSTNTIIREATYKNDTLNGKELTYYSNGNVMTEDIYADGEINGYSYFYDTANNLLQKKFFFHDVCLGPVVDYEQGEISKFRFYSFDNFRLFDLDYKTIETKSIDSWNSNLFFISSNIIQSDPINDEIETQFFIYIINPPHYRFQYSLCVADSANNIIKKIKEIDGSKIWETFSVDENSKLANQFFIFKLEIFDGKSLIKTLFDRNRY
ncbi:hypothetical protein GD597_11400 [Panacibacter sp. KCS-6]|uniref:MORN repeat protein n=2 Tax=Limnovirga soli TaxID=2656915 RepID=A0A8J8FDJ7_9BACT|nr:hypothetical protein [Limnovirga soli]